MSKVVRLPDDVVDLINDVKMTMLKHSEDDNVIYQIINNMNTMDIIKHCLRTVKIIHSEHLDKRSD